MVRLSLCSAPEGVKPMLLSVSKEEWESTGGKGRRKYDESSYRPYRVIYMSYRS